jgi:hypothetical protein
MREVLVQPEDALRSDNVRMTAHADDKLVTIADTQFEVLQVEEIAKCAAKANACLQGR